MNSTRAAATFSALAHASRLEIVRLLVPKGKAGLPAGEIADALGMGASRLSFHLAALENSGLLRSRRSSRNVLYAVNYGALGRLMAYLQNDCCQSHPAICGSGTTEETGGDAPGPIAAA